MFLRVLDKNCSKSAAYHADVHLAPSVIACAKLLSTAIQELMPEAVKIVKNDKGIREFKLEDMLFLPPILDPTFRPWIDWVKAEYQRAWWLITTCWMFDRELLTRFGPSVRQHPLAIRVNLWAQGGMVTKGFKRTGERVEAYPVLLPEGLQITVDPILDYRRHYNQLQTQTKMRWSGARNKPEWMGGPPEVAAVTPRPIPLAPPVCEKCGSDAGGHLCALTDCPQA